MNQKIAKKLLLQRDPNHCRKEILMYSAVILLLLLAHGIFSNFSSPLKLIPQTFAAIAMGWSLLCIFSLRQFPQIAEFIDWPKVIKATEPNDDDSGREIR